MCVDAVGLQLNHKSLSHFLGTTQNLKELYGGGYSDPRSYGQREGIGYESHSSSRFTGPFFLIFTSQPCYR